MKVVLTTEEPPEFITEDSGMASYIPAEGPIEVDGVLLGDDYFWVVIHSWDDLSGHEVISKLKDKNLRITIETID